MNGKGMTAVSTVLMVFPWTLLILRRFTWALQSPMGEILIGLYAGIMILGGVFTIWAYAKKGAQSGLMKVCTVVNGLYMVCGAAAFVMMSV